MLLESNFLVGIKPFLLLKTDSSALLMRQSVSNNYHQSPSNPKSLLKCITSANNTYPGGERERERSAARSEMGVSCAQT